MAPAKLSKIQTASESNPNIKFSFQYYDLSGKYCISKWSGEQIKRALEMLKDVNSKSFHELILQPGKGMRFHVVDWSDTTEKQGFPASVPKDWQPFQFELKSVNERKARVFGAYYAGTFYIVWFDLNHSIYPR